MSTQYPAPQPRLVCRAAFSLLEMLMAVGLIATLAALTLPVFQTLQTAGSMTRAAYEVAEVLENARSYAMANRTFVWVGFFEEDAAKRSPAPRGTGRVILSIVASRDGTQPYDDSDTSALIDSGRLIQVGKLVKIENIHLAILPLGTGNGTGETFATRPAVDEEYGRYGEINAASGSRPGTNSKFPFVYPLSGTAQYRFPKTLEFTPRGEAKVNGTYSLRPVVEIGLQATRGTVVNSNDKNVAAVQISGILGQTAVYRP